jgi:hypothetical protein
MRPRGEVFEKALTGKQKDRDLLAEEHVTGHTETSLYDNDRTERASIPLDWLF